MATLGAVRVALQGVIDNISGLRVKDTASPAVVPPVALIRYRGDVDGPYATFSGDAYDVFEITVLVPNVTADRAEDALDAYVSRSGSASIMAALDADPTLGGVVHFALFAGWESDRGDLEYNGKEYPAATGLVRCWHS